MGTRRQASFNPTLTTYATGVSQDLASALAEFIAPTCRVAAAMGQFKAFNDKNAFQVYNTERAVGGKPTRIEFDVEDPSYNCKPNALEITVDDSEREAAGEEGNSQLDEGKIKTLVSSTAVSHEVKVVSKTVGAMTPVAGLGVWSDPDVDPIFEIDSVISTIATDCGMMPNRFAIGLTAWQIIRNHPKVIARQPGAVVQGLTLQQFASMLLNPEIQVKVGVLSKDTAKMGKAAAKQNIVGANVLIFIGSENPTQYDPSFAKTFTAGRGNIAAVRTYRDEPFTDCHLVDWSEDIQITSTISGKLIALS